MEPEAPVPTPVDIKALADCFAPGAARASRLVFAADKLRGTPQEAEALRLAVATIKEATTDTAKFSELSTRLFSLGLGDPGLDAEAQQWISQADAAATSERAELDAEAARAKAAVDRAAVRASAVALGDWHARRGEPQAALRSFLRARDYCSTPRDVAEVCLRAASAAAAAGSWAHVSSYASRAASAAATAPTAAGASNDLSSPPAPPAAAAAPPVISSAAVATALAGCAAAAFDAGRWREAALGFVKAADAADVDGEGVAGVGGGVVVAAAAGSTSSSTYPLDADAACAPSLASPLDVALCGGLACLASLDRGELSSIALASPGFRDALSSLLPALLAAVEACAAARFGDCLALLRERVLPRARLDARASRAAPQLAAQAARRCLVQYAAPYSALSLDAARARLGFASRAELDEELAALVRKGAVKGRLDVPGGLLTKEAGGRGETAAVSALAGGDGGSSKIQQDVSPRSAVDAALEAGLAYVADSRALLLRAAMLAKGMVEQLPASSGAPATTAAAAAAAATAATTPGAGGGGGGGGAAAAGGGGRTRRGGSGEQRPHRSGRERAPAMT